MVRTLQRTAQAPTRTRSCRLASSLLCPWLTASYAAFVVAMALLAAVVLSRAEGERRTRTQAIVRALAPTAWRAAGKHRSAMTNL